MAATATTPSTRPDILFVDTASTIGQFSPVLSASYRLNATPHLSVAIEYIRRASPMLVMTELALDDGSGLDICEAAKAIPMPATVLVMSGEPEKVPDALVAGCDGVLLKPFSTNLLITRVSRLLRERSRVLRLQTARTLGKSMHLSERISDLRAGTNQVWPNAHCPYCGHGGVMSFDYASMRRAWYACLACRKVWLARRRDS